MSDDTPPKFKPNIPPHLLNTMSDTDRYLMEAASIHGQQNEWLMQRAVNADLRHARADARMDKIEARIAPFEELKVVLTAKWSVIAMLFSAIAIPVALAIFGAYISAWLNKH